MTLSGGPESPQPGTPEEGSNPPPPEDTPDNAVDAAAETPPSAPTTSDVVPEEQAQPSVETTAAAAKGETTPPTSGEAADAGVKPPPAKPAAERPARPAKAEEPKEAPRVAPPAGSIYDAVTAAASGIELKAYMVPEPRGEAVCVEVGRDDLPALMAACRDDARLDLKYLRCLSGIDWMEDGLEVAYHLWSFTKSHALTVKTRVSYDDANVPSIAALYPAADWHERETRDMFGINFEGHPNLVPLLLPEDMTDHFPLRKENPLQEIIEWQGENLREGAAEDEE